MRIAVISDSHLGFGYGTEKEEDSFRQFDEAITKAIAEKADLILLPGDVFDSRIPRQEVWARALEIFQKPLLAGKNGARLVQRMGKSELSPMIFSGIPVIAIHGTHERRSAGSVNPVEMLERAGFLIHLHFNGIMFEKNGERICVYGASGVPESYAREEFKKFRPALEQCKNILMFHQSLLGEVYSEDDAMLSADDLPAGFDLYIDGHIHAKKVIEGARRILLPGSTIITQQKKNESGLGKGFYMIDTENWALKFIELESQRPFYYCELNFQNASIEEIMKKARERVGEAAGKQNKMKPLVFLKITGNLEQGKEASSVREGEIGKGLNAIVTVSNELQAEDFKRKIEKLRERQSKRLSVDDMGMGLLREVLAGTKYSGMGIDDLIDELASGNTDSVLKQVLEKFGKS